MVHTVNKRQCICFISCVFCSGRGPTIGGGCEQSSFHKCIVAAGQRLIVKLDREDVFARNQQRGRFSEIERKLADALAGARPRDAAAGRALTGPHRGDLTVIHAAKDRPAAECSTGEQKALILNLILAQAARLSRAESQPNPILLLDEVAAHLDPLRRAALFDEIEALGLQAFLTGTDQSLFETFAGRALGVRVEESALSPLEA